MFITTKLVKSILTNCNVTNNPLSIVKISNYT